MWKRLITLIAFILSFPAVMAIENTDVSFDEISSPDEVVLEVEETFDGELDEMGITETEPEEASDGDTLRERLSDILHSEVDSIDKRHHLLSEILTKKFSDKSPVDTIHWWSGYNGSWSMNFLENDSLNNHYAFHALCTGFDGKMKDNNADFRVMFNFSPLSGKNMVRYLPGDVFVGTDKIPHHRIQIGNQRPANGMEGKASAFLLPFIARSQIARNYSTVRKVGGRIIGDYSLMEYDIGLYNSDTYFKKYFSGAEFDGWVNLKPLGKTKGKYGDLKIGGGVQTGRREGSYTVTGLYAGYEFKKFFATFEYANAHGANGLKMEDSHTHSDGFNATVGYRVTPKLQAVVRYDQFNPNKKLKNANKREMTLGLNYYIKGQGLKFMFNYVFCQNDLAKDSHRLMLGAQVLL